MVKMVSRKKSKSRVVYRYRRKRSMKGNTSSNGFLSKIGKPLGSAAYGALREKTSDMIANSAIGRKLPASVYTDEIVMLGLMYGLRKTGIAKKGIMASIIRNGETVEWARIGATVSDMFLTKKTAVNGNSSLFDGGGY
jgi:hypothetical protein